MPDRLEKRRRMSPMRMSLRRERPVRSVATWLVLALAVLPSAASDRDPVRVAAEVAGSLNEARREEGLPALALREDLFDVAARMAGDIAALPEGKRLNRDEPPVVEMLSQAGIRSLHRARLHVDLQLGSPHPAAAAMQRWRGYGPGWRDATDPSLDAVGIGAALADDGWLIVVAILLEDIPDPGDIRALERRVEERVNAERTELGLRALRHSRRLARVARSHSEDMAARSYFAHESPEGRDVADRARAEGIVFRAISENIAQSRGVDDPVSTAVDGWLDSPGHYINMMNPQVTHTAVGIAIAPTGTIYFTQVFLLPTP